MPGAIGLSEKERIDLGNQFVDCGIAEEVNHWHGAAPDSWFSHLAIEIEGENTSTEWCEKVSEDDYFNAVNKNKF